MEWWSKYQKNYRVRASIDEGTGNYPKVKIADDGNEEGKYSKNDVFIECDKGIIYLYDKGIFEVFVCDFKNGTNKSQTLNKLIKKYPNKIIEKSAMYGDGEGSFRIKKKDVEFFIKELGGDYVNGINRSPFLAKNLLKEDYEIPLSDLEKYDTIFNKKFKGEKINISIYNKIYRAFANDILKLDQKDYTKKLRKEKLKSREYLHSIGKWDELIKFTKLWLDTELA